MSGAQIAIFLGAAVGSVVALKLIFSPQAFRLAAMGLAAGVTAGLSITYVNSVRKHSLKASYVPIGLTAVPTSYPEMRNSLYSHLKQEYEDRGELELGEETITVQPNVFAQMGVIDVEGVRRMWSKAVIPSVRGTSASTVLKTSTYSDSEVAKNIVFCDIGSGVGNVCLQVLAETKCEKTVGIDVIPSRVRAAEDASTKAKKLYPEVFDKKQARWFCEDLADSVRTLTDEHVNVVFTHSWMFDDDLMKILTTVIDSVPSIDCVVTSRKLDSDLLKGNPLQLVSLMHFSADWNDEAPFYVYSKYKGN